MISVIESIVLLKINANFVKGFLAFYHRLGITRFPRKTQRLTELPVWMRASFALSILVSSVEMSKAWTMWLQNSTAIPTHWNRMRTIHQNWMHQGQSFRIM